MKENILDSIQYGGTFFQMTLFAIAALVLTFPVKNENKKKRAMLQWCIPLVVSFIMGFVGCYGLNILTDHVNSKADVYGAVVIHFVYEAVTLLNVGYNCIPAAVVVLSIVILCKEKKKIKIFTAILFMLMEAFILLFFSDVTKIFFSPGIEDNYRMEPNFVICHLINAVWLTIALLVYRKLFLKKLADVLTYAEEEIGNIILVPMISFFMAQVVMGIFDTYGIILMSVKPSFVVISFMMILSLWIIYFLMYRSIFKVVVVSAGSAKVKAELDVASKIQLSALPSDFPASPERKEFDIYASMKPAKEVGGDFYDFFLVDEDHLAVLIADVSGKGVPAALFMMGGQAIIRNQAMLGIEPGKIFENANNQLVLKNKEEMFITAFFGILNLKNGEFRYCNAGHNVPYLCNQNGEVREVPMHHGFVLAGMENIRYRTEQIVLEFGEKLVLYTDGVTEAINPAMEMYTEKRLVEVLGNSAKKDTRGTVEAINDSVFHFADTAEQFDDITVLVLERTPENEGDLK